MNLKLESRTRCSICDQATLRRLKKIEAFPVLPVCVDQPFEQDHFAPLDVGLCDTCGAIQLMTLVDPAFIYSLPHSEGIGATWAAHYATFGDSVAGVVSSVNQPKVLEVGAGQGQIVNLLKNQCHLTVIEPNYGGSREQIEVIDGFFRADSLTERQANYDVVYSSHTLEHFYHVREYFEAAALVLKYGGQLLTAVPNLESALQAGYANALQFEHTVMLTLPHLLRLHQEFGFEVSGVSYYRDHGIYLYAKKTGHKEILDINTKQYMEYLFDKLLNGIEKRKATIEAQLKPNVPHYLFGASQLSQFLFACGLEAKRFDGLLDNASSKSQKRLYGTPLASEVPGKIFATLPGGQVFINGGPYTQEIYSQLKEFENNRVELICL